MSHPDKPRPSLIRLLNDLADRRAIHQLLGTPEELVDRDSLEYAERRIPAARRETTVEREYEWRDGRWAPRETIDDDR